MSDLGRIRRKYLFIGSIAVACIGFFVYAFAVAPQKAQGIQDTNTAQFRHDVEEAKEPILVDFWSETCGPCVELEPTIRTIAAKYTGKIRVLRVIADINPDILKHYDVDKLPTLLFFKGGKVVDKIIGKQSQEIIEKTIEKVLR